jgi:hypothetical protein
MKAFEGFSAESFEQFIRVLALKVLGPGVTIFGNGPDGGREASFHGRVNYPFPPAQQWEGYGVIQAKFKERQEGTRKEQSWAEAQLSAELAKWMSSAKRNPKPDYFVFCTNVDLTSGAGGGRATLERILKEKSASIGMKQYAIWDMNQLMAYVDGHQEIRTRFLTFFTPGDLLAQFAKQFSQIPDPDSVLTAFLCRDLLADEDARLSQAGDRSEDRIRLADVFIDLPARDSPDQIAYELEETEPLPAASLHALAITAAHKLDPLALDDHRQPQEASDEGHKQRLYGRHLFIGGPGSGKSTIGQFLAQMHRAALLDRRSKYRLESGVRNIIGAIKARAAEESFAWPTTPRFPFRVELNAFAKALAATGRDSVSTLSEYLRRALSHDIQVSHIDLREWLRSFPWLLVLDGLDEVPSSSNRRQVVSAIQNFLGEARDVEADILVVATSRPDGYDGEFDGEEVRSHFLLPLSKQRALACAKRYLDAKSRAKNDQRSVEAMQTLTAAIEGPLVARLMASPLQVTFMVTVVVASGKPSESRWQLFNDYYRTIYERELHKAVRPFDRVLNERRQDIDALHYRVGFILQCRAERSGGTQSDLGIDEFETLVDRCLRENGLDGEWLTNQRAMIVDAAKLRLVFLTSRTVGRLSFDIRSLQEYMAAACITNADSNEIIDRLELVAHSAYWRNTFLFAVGRFFVEPRMRVHRDKIRLLCEDLNRKDPQRASVKLGSRLALEILESGTVGDVPLVSRSLAECSLDLLADPPPRFEDLPQRLAGIYDGPMEDEFRKAISVWLGQSELSRSLRAWMVLLFLEQGGTSWATPLIAAKWPTDSQHALLVARRWLAASNIYHAESRPVMAVEASGRTADLARNLSLQSAYSLFQAIDDRRSMGEPAWLGDVVDLVRSRFLRLMNVIAEDKLMLFQLPIMPLRSEAERGARAALHVAQIPGSHPDWQRAAPVFEFIAEPSVVRLASALETLADTDTADLEMWMQVSPWPLRACLVTRTDSQSLRALATSVRSNALGSEADWKALEARWNDEGIGIEEYCGLLFKTEIPAMGIAGHLSFDAVAAPRILRYVKHLINRVRALPPSSTKESVAWGLHYLVGSVDVPSDSRVDLMQDILQSRVTWDSTAFGLNPTFFQKHIDRWIPFFDAVGRSPKLTFSDFMWDPDELPVESLLDAFAADRNRVGLLRLAAFWSAAGVTISNSMVPSMRIDAIEPREFRWSVLLLQTCHIALDSERARTVAAQLGDIIRSAENKSAILESFASAIENHAKVIPATREVLEEVYSHVPETDWELRGRMEAVRLTLLQGLPSSFDPPSLERMGLPYLDHEQSDHTVH